MNTIRYSLAIALAAGLTFAGCSTQRNADDGASSAARPAGNNSATALKSSAPEGGAATSGEEKASEAAASGEAAATTTADGNVFVAKVARVDGVVGGSGQKAPNFTWKDAKGVERSLSQYRGKVVMINFWGTWCPPCRAELPDIVRLRDELAPKGFEVIGLNVGEEMRSRGVPEQAVAAFAKKNDLRYPLMLAGEDVINAYGGLEGVPTTFIVNGKGEIVKKMVGMQSEATFRTAVQNAM